MGSEATQFSRTSNPNRQGLDPLEAPVSPKVTGVRLFEADLSRLEKVPDRASFLRNAIHNALDALEQH